MLCCCGVVWWCGGASRLLMLFCVVSVVAYSSVRSIFKYYHNFYPPFPRRSSLVVTTRAMDLSFLSCRSSRASSSSRLRHRVAWEEGKGEGTTVRNNFLNLPIQVVFIIGSPPACPLALPPRLSQLLLSRRMFLPALFLRLYPLAFFHHLHPHLQRSLSPL